ncbi:MAG: peptidase [Gammaproteobacteria bacterium]|nr:peptidase [Gammaproteobacteria bacterium]
MVFIFLIIILLLLVFMPNIWVKRVMNKYSNPKDRYSGTGADLARHLLDKNDLHQISIETTEDGDHYDPEDKTVRLTNEKYSQCSLTAITVAAHEVGHAIQDKESYRPLVFRSRLVKLTLKLEKVGAAILMLSPFIGALTRAPGLSMIVFLGGFLTLLSSTLVHFVTLPTEIDASFNRALPMLEKHNILKKTDKRHARKILQAAAFTYIASSLMSLLNIARWWAILRR